MQFKSHKGKRVLVGSKIFTFKSEVETVEDKATQEALKKAQGVEVVKTKKEASQGALLLYKGLLCLM